MNSQLDQLQKKYFEELPKGYFVDVKVSENEWKVGRVMEKDNKYMVVSYDDSSATKE